MAAGNRFRLRGVLATNLRRERAAQSLSQEALGDLAGLHRTFIGAVERCETNISLENIERLAGALNTEAWQLLKPGADRP